MSAVISDDGRYRYRLDRPSMFGDGSTAVIMVNTSTADGSLDDPTIRKLRGFGRRYLWGNIIVGNLFALRATDVRDLAKVTDPVGHLNDAYLLQIFAECRQVICAWGPLEKQPRNERGWRSKHVVSLAQMFDIPMLCLGVCKSGEPKHPLTLGYSCAPRAWAPPV